MRRRDSRGCRWRWKRCSSRRMCGAPCHSPSGSAGSAESRSAPDWSGRSPRFCATINGKRRKRRRMRRASLLLLLVVMGCSALRDAFSPRADVVARANDQTLSVETVADWAGGSKQVPLEPLAFRRLSHVWVDYALFAQALAAGNDLRDTATMTAAMWPIVSQLKWERFHDRLVKQGDLSPQQVDSVYTAGQLRIFQHILVQVPPNSTPVVEAQKRRKAEQLLPQARTAGTRFGQLASANSDDPGSKTQGGALGLTARGQFVPAFEDAAWQLQPGEVSPVVKSPFGFHIIRRPPLGEV